MQTSRLCVLALLAGASILPISAAAQAQSRPAAGETGASERLDDGTIVVTAQRREQALEDVPIAVSVFTADRLERSNISSLQGFADLTPNLGYANEGSPFQTS